MPKLHLALEKLGTSAADPRHYLDMIRYHLRTDVLLPSCKKDVLFMWTVLLGLLQSEAATEVS